MSAWSLKNKRNLNFLLFISKKCLKAVSSLKTKKVTKPFQRKNIIFLCFFWICIPTLVIKWDYTYRLNSQSLGPLNKRKGSTRLMVCLFTYYGGNECIPKIAIAWIWLNYLTYVALFFNLSFFIVDLLL